MKTLTEQDYINAVQELGCEVAAIKAVSEVEAPKGGFQADGRPNILFERHKFHEFTSGKYSADNPEISNPRPGGYTNNEHARLEKASKLNRNAALKSASFSFLIIKITFLNPAFY